MEKKRSSFIYEPKKIHFQSVAQNKGTLFPRIVFAEAIVFLIWKSKGHST